MRINSEEVSVNSSVMTTYKKPIGRVFAEYKTKVAENGFMNVSLASQKKGNVARKSQLTNSL